MKLIRVIIAGSREFTDYGYLENKLDEILYGLDYEDIEIVSGACRGVDQLGERYAIENSLPIKHFPANWDRDGRGAGFKRNTQMAKYANMLIAFQVNESKGTQHMINTATAHKLRVAVFRPDGQDYVIESNSLLVMSSEQGSNESLNDTQNNKTNHAIGVKNTMTFSNKNLGWDLPCYPKDKEAPIYLWRKRMDEVESISKIEFDKVKFISIPQGVVCLFEATDVPAGSKVNIIECPYLAILLHSVEYKVYNFDLKAQETIKPTAGELAYIEFLKTNGWLEEDAAIGEGFFRYIADLESLKENAKWCFSAEFSETPENYKAFNAIAKQIKDGCGTVNGNGKTYAPKQTPAERLAEVKPLVVQEIELLAIDDPTLQIIKSLDITPFEYLSLLFK